MEHITRELAARLLPKRAADGHKGTFGKVAVVGGSVGYTGAPVYAAEAATRCGSGLVFLFTPAEVYPIVAARCDSAMAAPIPADRVELLERLRGCDAALIGPGLGRKKEQWDLARFLLENLEIPVVLDADGINAAAAHTDIWDDRRGPTVVTPHEGEFIRLGGDGKAPREAETLRLAALLGCTVVRKGPGTLVASADRPLRRNTTGSCALSKGGSGDVLAGMIVSFIGQGCAAPDAAALAVYLHGRAGDRIEQRLTAYGLAPSDLVGEIPYCIRELL